MRHSSQSLRSVLVIACMLGALASRAGAQEVTGPKKVTIALRGDAQHPTLGWFGLGLDCPECDGDGRASDTQPAIVTHVAHGGPADQAALLVGDTLLAIDGKPMTSRQLRATLAAAPLGGVLRVLVGRSLGRTTVNLTKHEGTVERINGKMFTVRYRSDYGDVAIDVLSAESPIVRRDSTGALMIRIGDNIIRLRRDLPNAAKPPAK